MVQSGYEASAVLGGNSKFGDTWKMLQWQVSGRMGGRKGAPKSKDANGNGHTTSSSRPLIPPPQPAEKEEAFRIL
jgi:hypothetical protein